ncbi:MAG: TlpA family protein disulfide reductase [Acidobacteria bacterium]|jgi:peroxiredoxin|nr:TlpA family protein disulfide reductase [Acidobacteriota bacterium]
MKKIMFILLLFFLIIPSLMAVSGTSNKSTPPETKMITATQKETMEMIYRLYGQQEYEKVLPIIEKAMKEFGITTELLKLKFNILVAQEKYDTALAFIDGEIKRSGKTESLLAARFELLYNWKKWQEALETAREKDKITKPKSPWDAMNIMHVYLAMGRKEDALDALQEAVSRGFISYRILTDQKYESLASETRFFEIIETIKIAIGLGKPAKNFSVKLINGDTFTLANQRGKVVLLYFWATWCEPCKEEIPGLVKIYEEFKDKNFDMIGISLDSSAGKLMNYSRTNNLNLKMYCSSKTWNDPVVIHYGVNSLPSLWLIDKKGVLRSFDIKSEELRQAIISLLAEK